MIRQILLGTRNPARIELIRRILEETPVRVITLDQLGIDLVVTEDGRSTRENAEKKARAYFRQTGIPTFSQDGGLHIARFAPVDQPGVLVKRLGQQQPLHSELNAEEEIMNYYRRAISAVGGQSAATWTGSQALCLAPDRCYAESFTFDVLFTNQPKGFPAPGTPLDSLMIDPASGLYYTDLPVEKRPYYFPTADFLLRHLDL